MTDYAPLYKSLGYHFKSEELLTRALTHSSLNQHVNYERLEFLGDRILGFEIAALLYEQFPEDNEGKLARRLVNLVRQETLAKIAHNMGLPDFILLSKGESKTGGNYKDSVLADCCESILAAVYLEGGLDAAHELIQRFWKPFIEKDMAAEKDAKSKLQEYVQARGKRLPEYNVIEESGAKHSPTFVIEVVCQGYPPMQGTGPSKRAATQDAAEKMLTYLKSEAHK